MESNTYGKFIQNNDHLVELIALLHQIYMSFLYYSLMAGYYILGAGGQARQVLSIAGTGARQMRVEGFIGLESEKGKVVNGTHVLTESDIKSLDRRDVVLLNGLGRPNRKSVIERLVSIGFSFDSLMHPSANVGEFVLVGTGTVIQSGVGIMTNVELGKFTLIDINATIGHDISIGDYTTISTGVNLAGGVSIGSGCWIGSGSVIIEGVSVGEGVLLGAGSVVTRDIPSGKMAYGVPARVVKDIGDVSEALLTK